jgi:hypothetical protein
MNLSVPADGTYFVTQVAVAPGRLLLTCISRSCGLTMGCA